MNAATHFPGFHWFPEPEPVAPKRKRVNGVDPHAVAAEPVVCFLSARFGKNRPFRALAAYHGGSDE